LTKEEALISFNSKEHLITAVII